MTVPPMSQKVANAIDSALCLVGHRPDTYDVDAVFGSLMQAGVHVVTADQIEAQMFTDRCDFECSICHPEDET